MRATASSSVPELRYYQKEIVEDVSRALADGGSGQVVMACGSGKTLVALKAAERVLRPGEVAAMFFPSVALAAQSLGYWLKHATVPIDPLAITGDESVADSAVQVRDLPVPVTTDVGQITEWLAQPRAEVGLVVCTLASGHRLAEAVRASAPLGLRVFDEAHHLAGRLDAPTRKLLDREFLPARTSLFLTATRRIDLRPSSADAVPVVGMDDEEVFGPILGKYSFAQGVKDNYLRDWRLAIICVSDTEARAALPDLDAAQFGGDGGLPLRLAAAQIALARAREEFGISRVLTFQPRVRLAELFATTLHATLLRLAPAQARGLYAKHVHGEMDQHARSIVLDALARERPGGWASVSSARCLSEGVDTPAVDAVLISHAKRSEVDIIQVVGRAMRRAPGVQGPSIIILPHIVYGDGADDPDPDEFDTVMAVLGALRAHDEDFAADLERRRKQAPAERSYALPEKVTFHVSEAIGEKFLRAVTLRVVEDDCTSWLDGYYAARAYHQEHGHLNVRKDYVTPDGYPLGRWLEHQRYYPTSRARSDPELSRKLDEIGMVWAGRHEQAWWRQYGLLKEYKAKHGNTDLRKTYVTADGDKLGAWLANQRKRKSSLSDERIAALDELGIDWKVDKSRAEPRWKAAFNAAAAFHADHGHLQMPLDLITAEGVNLSTWLHRQRAIRRGTAEGTLTDEQINALDALGMRWLPAQERPPHDTTAPDARAEANPHPGGINDDDRL